MQSETSETPQFDYLPLTLGIETLGDLTTPVVRRGTPLPTKRSQKFSTATDNQESVEISVVMGERPLAADNMSVGRCMLKNIPPAPKGTPKIRVTFEIDKSCSVKVMAIDAESGESLDADLQQTVALTEEMVRNLLAEAESSRREDETRAILAEAETRVRNDQERGSVTQTTTTKIEELIGQAGTALAEGDGAVAWGKANQLKKLLRTATAGEPWFTDLGQLFPGFGQSAKAKKVPPEGPAGETTRPASVKHRTQDSSAPIPTPGTVLVQSFLDSVDPELETKRAGAWQALESGRSDGCAQASHSMREVLRILIDKLAPVAEVTKCRWYVKPRSGAPVTRAMKVRYTLGGPGRTVSESTLSLIDGLSTTVDSMYSKLSAQSHGRKATVTETRVFLSACENIIALIATQRQP